MLTVCPNVTLAVKEVKNSNFNAKTRQESEVHIPQNNLTPVLNQLKTASSHSMLSHKVFFDVTINPTPVATDNTVYKETGNYWY